MIKNSVMFQEIRNLNKTNSEAQGAPAGTAAAVDPLPLPVPLSSPAPTHADIKES